MKKLTLIIPAVLVALTALAVPLVTMFTTAAAYDVSLAKNSYFGDFHDEVKIFKESYKYIETAAKLSPNRETLGKRVDLFCVHREGTNIADLEAACPDFKQKAIKYSGEFVDYIKNNDYRISIYGRQFSDSGDAKLQDVSYALYTHLIQVYQYSDKQEAKKLADGFVHSLPVERLSASVPILQFARGIEHDSTENEKWAEALVDYVLTTHNANLAKISAAFADEEMKPRKEFNSAQWLSVGEDGYIIADVDEDYYYR
jgi:hypothetical protein